MIQSPFLLALVLTALTAGILGARKARGTAFLFRWLPAPFFCYFVPTCLAAGGVLPAANAIYGWAARFLLPVCLALLLVNVNLRSLASLGRPALAAMAWGAGGIVSGMTLSFGLFHRWLPAEAWKSAGALAGSWTGGSANMVAVKEALAAPENVFSPMLIVDTVFAYGWMAFLIWLAGRQSAVNRLLGADAVAEPNASVPAEDVRRVWPWASAPLAALSLAVFALGFGEFCGPWLNGRLGTVFPGIAKSLRPATWTVLAVTTASLAVSLAVRFARPERTEGAGYFLLFLLLTTLGAQASFSALGKAPVFLAVGAGTLLVHGFFLAVGGRLGRIPLGLLATASQACVGGPVSAPLVGAVYRPGLAAVGLLLAVGGGIAGTYVGLVTAQLCAWVGG